MPAHHVKREPDDGTEAMHPSVRRSRAGLRVAVAMVAVLVTAPTVASAQEHRGGGGGRPGVGFHGNSGAWHGGGWRQGWHGGRYGWWWAVPGYGWYAYDAPIYPYPEPYGYTYAYPYADQGPAVAPGYPAPGYGAPAAPTAANWYYCRNPSGYYPYVQQCNGPWQPVPAQPPPG